MNKSETISALTTALAMAQGELENASKNSVNPHFKNRYADLAEVLNTVRPVLAKHGLAVVQFPAYEAGVASVETVLTHKSGEWMSGVASCKITKDDPQGYGSALTYLRRYSLASVVGISQEDDDAQTASKPVVKKVSPEKSSELFNELMASCKTGGKPLFQQNWKGISADERHLISEEQMSELSLACKVFEESMEAVNG